MKKLVRRVLQLGAFLTVINIAVYAGYSLSGNHVAVPFNIGVTTTQDPTLVADAQQLGLDYSNVNLNYAPTLHADDIADDSMTVGVFTAPNSIHIKSGLSHEEELNIVAYEFMHYYWQNLSADTRNNLTVTYQNYYDSNYTFRQLTSPYTGSPETLADERNSNACTRVQPYALTEQFNAYCNSFIPNRNILFD